MYGFAFERCINQGLRIMSPSILHAALDYRALAESNFCLAANKMTDLYSKCMPDIQAIASPLFEFSEKCLRKRNNFVPHGAVLTEDGKIVLVGAAPDMSNKKTNSAEVLPILHHGLREQAAKRSIVATGVAENVTVAREGERATDAIKVLFEHRAGLVVALYLPFKRRLLRGYEFGSVFSVPAKPEVNAWRPNAA